MNFNTLKQELNKKIKKMSEEDFTNFINELKQMYCKAHNPYYYALHKDMADTENENEEDIER